MTKIVAASVSDRGLSDKRPQNEDSFLELSDNGIFAVADGVGGAQAGDVASQMAVEILGEAFRNQNGADAEDVMRRAIDRANEAIFQMANDLPQLASMATTIVALHVDGNIATIGHVGDSRLYRIGRDGTIHRETQDHSVVEEEVRAGRITEEQALNHPSRNIISRALGAESTVEIDMKTIMIDPGTRFLLCSDGITRHIDDTELATMLSSSREPAEICSQMKAICYERGAEDNLTAVIVNIAETAEVAADAMESATIADGLEEATIATARSPFESLAENDDLSSDITFEHLGMPADAPTDADTDEQFLMGGEPELPTDDITPQAEQVAVDSRPTNTSGAPAFQPFGHGHATSSGFGGKILPAVIALLIGAVLGAAGYRMWFQTSPEPVISPEPTPITEMKSNNTPLTSFEEGRRLVDGDPQRYLSANTAAPQDAEDYFLLGRAFLLTGKYWEAKRSFNEARNRLSQAQEENARTLGAEIAMALAIIESPSATELFAREVKGASAVIPASESAGAGQPSPVQ